MKKYNNILISGASSGMGAELVRRFAKQGKSIGLLALPDSNLYKIQVEATQLGAKAVYPYPLDICDRQAVRDAVQDFATTCGSIDLWIACAGVDVDVPLAGFDDAGAQQIEKMYDINLKGLIYSTNAVLEQMLNGNQHKPKNKHRDKDKRIRQGLKGLLKPFSLAKALTPKNKKLAGKGHIVGLSSLAGQAIFPSHADYSASKTAVDAYLESLRVRLTKTGIIVTTVSPGFVKTPMTQAHTHPMPFIVSAEQAVDEILQGIAKGSEHIAFPTPLVMSTKMLKLLPEKAWKKVARLSVLLSSDKK